MNLAATRTRTAEEIDRLAHKRVAARLGWYRHALVFLAVSGLLLVVGALHGRGPMPLWGWAFGLAVHGLVVFFGSGDLKERMVERERQRLALQRDPW